MEGWTDWRRHESTAAEKDGKPFRNDGFATTVPGCRSFVERAEQQNR
jgi:hypothetical protein